ncbi:MAG: hypothetical protein ABIG63_13070 [Chloroflexota bacterium]
MLANLAAYPLGEAKSLQMGLGVLLSPKTHFLARNIFDFIT